MITPRILFLKSEPQQPKAGEHWITVRPPGHEKGQPILVQDQPDGSMKVVGGAGGALNHLRFTPGHKGEDRKAVAAKRQEEARAAKKARIERDKELGLHEAKQGVRKKLADQRRAAEKEFISSVADQMGWDKAQLEFPAEKFAHLSDKAQAKLQRHHHAALLKQATKAVDQHREWLVHDHAARAEAGLGELPLVTPDAETVSVQDLDPVTPSGASLGHSADFAARADAAGASQAAISAEIAESKPPMTDEQRSAALARGKAAEMVKDEIASIADPVAPTLQTKIDDAKKAVSLIAARKRLDSLRQQLADAGREVDATVAEPKAPVLELDDEKVAEDVRKQIADDLKTASTRAFLSATAEVGEENLRAHIGVGAYNSLNALSLTASGAALLDRSVVDVLGISGAAQVLARRLKADLSPDDYQRVADGMAEYHASMHADRANEAVAKAKEAQDLAEAIDVDAAHDLTEAQALNHTRRDAIEAARRALGTALGELEANAALVAELKTGARDEVQVPMGGLTPQAVVTQLRAIGLEKGDYLLDKVGGETFVTINADGLDRLTAPVNKADMEQVRRNLAIIRGEHDEDDWLPIGFANRRDLAMHVEPGVVQRMAEPFSPGEDLAESLRDYIGGRAADGDTPADIVADIQSAAFFDKAGAERRKEYAAALEAVAPLKDAKGKMQRAEALQGQFEAYADAFVEKRGAARLPLHRQKIDVDQVSVDALHRALADHPDGVAAYKPVGDLTKQDQRSLRDFFYREIAHESPEAADLRHQYEGHLAAEPEKETVDMFGETTTNPEWSEWRARRDELSAAVGKSSLDWQKYVDSMRGHAKAYESLQDVIRSRVSESFAQHHNRLRPDAPVAVGRTVIRNNLNHLDAVDPAAREARAAKERELIDALRDRVAGKYASGSVKDKLDAAKEQQAAFEQAQMGFFSTEDLFGADDTVKESAPLAADERHTLGHAAEMQIAGMMGIVGRQFKPGQPVKLWNVSMNGKYAPQQRAIKMLEANKRLGLGFGAGSGKTSIMLGAFSHLHGKGKIKRAVMLVPSIVQGQFGGEALRYLEPGKYKWHAEPGASRAERIAAYKDPDTHFVVQTHQSFRDDMIHLGAQHEGIEPFEMTERLRSMSPGDRQSWIRGVLEKEGIAFDATMVDEAHETLNREGKQDSTLANVTDALSAHTPYYVYASGDPVKNDVSEAFDLLRKCDPARYTDRAAFMRRYGVDTDAARSELKREMARYVYSHTISPDVTAHHNEHAIELSGGQKAALKEMDGHFARARLARMRGQVDVDACRAISPSSFDGVPEDQHHAVAAQLQKSLGMLKLSVERRIINDHPDNAKIEKTVELAKARHGRQGVVFAHSLSAVEATAKRLQAEGFRVVTITGADSSKDKDAKRKKFTPESGEPEADIMVASDAAAVGMNLQSGRYLIQHDTPDTAKAQPMSAKILTPSGWRFMGDIVVGDVVIAGDGSPATVTGVFPQGMKQVYSVEMASGASTECCAEHLWMTRMPHERRAGSEGSVRVLADIMGNLRYQDGHATHAIPLLSGPAQFDAVDLPIDPYLLGLLLGDGCFGEDWVSLTTADEFIANEVMSIASRDGFVVSQDKSSSITYRLTGDGSGSGYPFKRNSPIVHAARDLDLLGTRSHNKFIPTAYLFASTEARIALVRGLMDSDGTVDRRTGSATFCTCSSVLLDCFTAVVRSLGGRATCRRGNITTYQANGEKREGITSYKATVVLPMNPFLLPRKASLYKSAEAASKMYDPIVAVTPIGEKECQCIEIDHPSHLYVTDDFIVTHNTHGQRNARIHRLGQKQDVELHDLVADHSSERRARARLSKKYGLRELMLSPMDALDDTGLAYFLHQRKVASQADQGGLF